jgi:hypothetical protein
MNIAEVAERAREPTRHRAVSLDDQNTWVITAQPASPAPGLHAFHSE